MNLKWFQDHSNAIQAGAAIVQTMIAALMLWTLYQSSRVLEITTRQLEGTIDPVVTSRMFGHTIRLTNEGSVDVSLIAKTAIITAWFDSELKKITECQVNRGEQILKDTLRRGDSVDIDLGSLLIPLGTDVPKDSRRGLTVYGLVVTYRRTADMKPFVMFFPFSVGRDSKTQTTDIFMPLFPSSGSAEVGPTSDRSFEEARTELINLYRDKVAQIDIR